MGFEFLEVFLIDLLDMRLNRYIDFRIDLELSTSPISIPHYRVTPTALRKQLKTKLEHFLEDIP